MNNHKNKTQKRDKSQNFYSSSKDKENRQRNNGRYG